MRELPEIEIIRRDLDREVVGRKVKEANASGMELLPRYRNRKSFTNLLDGAKFTGVTRVGLHLVVAIDGGDALVITLGDRGRFRRNQTRDAVEPGTQLVISFTQGPQLRLIDVAVGDDSEMFVTPADTIVEVLPEVSSYGFDPVENVLSWLRFGELIVNRRAPLKQVLTDPQTVVGIGPVYADEILFEAGLRFDRSSTTLSTQEIRRLYRALVEIVHDSIKHRGATIPDDDFADIAGQPGSYYELMQVYGRDGQLSPRSRLPILKTKYEGVWTYYCDTQV